MAKPRDERSAISSVPANRDSVVSQTQHVATDVEASWLDRLLLATCQAPIAEGEIAVAEFMVRALGQIFPESGVGACLVDVSVQDASGREGQYLVKYVPEGQERRAQGMDPTRLFAGFAFERVLQVDPNGTTLHVASDDPQIDDDHSPLLHVMRRACLALAHSLGLARSHAKAMTDSRDLRVLNSHMVQAEKLASLGQLAAGIVHELNNPLTSIVAYTDWLVRRSGVQGDPDSLERLRRIGESATRILRFTRDLVAYARPSAEVAGPVSLHTVIDQALAFCEHVIDEHGAHVERCFAPDLPTVQGMSEQLAQVFVNLFTNACHAMPPSGGKLVVSTQVEQAPDRARIRVVVEDNGHGIAPEHVAQIFAPFFTTKGEGRGTGLGLSIVKNILDNHRAEIRAERSDDGGARFVLTFATT